ncbi:antibiotic biosynthesis monooxygenase family protein [Acinetobacter pragensis]|uniref:antibiotic biosynthesis monooxygenase family protein n=1 Tax=Acinetobacter pragensis TaxID=1806892 RepID=UPI003340DD08
MKYVVIFKAKIKQFDEHYAQTAQLMREKALTEFHCQHFEALCENNQEIALSYWNQLEDIQAWHADAEHIAAQQLGKTQWYAHFSVEVCEIQRCYSSDRMK